MKKILTLLALVLCLAACQHDQNVPIIKPQDYEIYLTPQARAVGQSFASKEISFWQKKLKDNPENGQYLIQLANAYGQKFREDGNIGHIHTSDMLYQKSLEIYPFDKAGIYRSLAANAITRHSFKEAYDLVYEAIKTGSGKAANQLLLFDVAMELGLYKEAQQAIDLKRTQSGFHYLIRASKMADHKGDLDLAIDLMEQAFEKKKNDPVLFQWAKSNLGDMYGHAGRVAEAYDAYLEVLAVNPRHWRSWQGVAWIAYAHDGDLVEAERIIDFISGQSKDPQISLLKADIAASKGLEAAAQRWKKKFYQEANQSIYGQMYNKHLALIEAEDLNEPAKAIERLEIELELRKTPEVYNVLAWAHHLNGNTKKAVELAEGFVKGKTYEPDALYHIGMIYAQHGRQKQAHLLLEEALEASFELGPITTAEIRQALAN